MKKQAKIFVLIFLTLVSLVSVVAAQKQFSGRWGIPEKPYECEQNAAEMEQVLVVMKNEPNPKGVLVLIARLGTGETDRWLNKRRLFNISERYKVLGVPAEKIVVAEGENVNDFGRVEIYWNGELLGALAAHKERRICLNCCESDEKLYPDLRENQPQSKQKRKKYD